MKLEDRCIFYEKIKDKTDPFFYACNNRCNGFNTDCEKYTPIKQAIEKVEQKKDLPNFQKKNVYMNDAIVSKIEEEK